MSWVELGKDSGERGKRGTEGRVGEVVGEWIMTGKIDVSKKRYMTEEETPRPNYEEFGFHQKRMSNHWRIFF